MTWLSTSPFLLACPYEVVRAVPKHHGANPPHRAWDYIAEAEESGISHVTDTPFCIVSSLMFIDFQKVHFTVLHLESVHFFQAKWSDKKNTTCVGVLQGLLCASPSNSLESGDKDPNVIFFIRISFCWTYSYWRHWMLYYSPLSFSLISLSFHTFSYVWNSAQLHHAGCGKPAAASDSQPRFITSFAFLFGTPTRLKTPGGWILGKSNPGHGQSHINTNLGKR